MHRLRSKGCTSFIELDGRMSCCPVPPIQTPNIVLYGNQTPLNGAGANTEGGRLRRLMKFQNNGVTCVADTAPNACGVCKPPQTEQPPITPAESSRIHDVMVRCGTGTQSGYVTQDRVRELLARTNQGKQFGSEDQRIQNVIQNVALCSTYPNDPLERFLNKNVNGSNVYVGYAFPEACPPLPPPPAPPARACVLTKNEKY